MPGLLILLLSTPLCDFCGSSLLTLSKRLESQMRSAEQPGVVTTFRRNNFEPPYRHRKGASRNFFMHVFFKQLPTIRYATTNHDHFGVEQIHEVGETNAEITSHLLEHSECQFIALRPRIIDSLRR